jgi:alanyl-tRNA synthetase
MEITMDIHYWNSQTSGQDVETYVVNQGRDQLGDWVALGHAVAHPRGGGQLGDRGSLGGVEFFDVRRDRESGFTRYYLSEGTICRFLDGQDVIVKIDQEFRLKNSLWHTCGHLTAAVVDEMYSNVNAFNGHHFPSEGRIEFRVQDSALIDVGAVNAAIDDVLKKKLIVATSHHPDGMRYVGIAGFPSVGCGGTHLESLGEIKSLTVTKAALKNDILRLSYTCT